MKQILLLSILSISLFSLLGCNDTKQDTTEKKIEKSSTSTSIPNTSTKEANKEKTNVQTKSGSNVPTP